MKLKSGVFFLWLSLLMVIFISGCISLPQNQKCSELEERVAKIEKRVDKIEKGNVKAGTKIIAEEEGISPKATYSSQPLIKFPSNEDIQIALKNAGFYDGNIDGKIGTKTRSAIKEFQKQNDLEIDGVVGRNTWEVFSKYYYIPAEEASNAEVKVSEEKTQGEAKAEIKEEAKEETAAQPDIGD